MNSSVAVKPSDLSSHSITLPHSTSTSTRLPSALEFKSSLPLNTALTEQVAAHRRAVSAILEGQDSRLLVIVGPCSLHDPQSALEYAERLAGLASEVSDQMLLVMRAYVEKPRTTVGWKGLAYDPRLDGSDDMAVGLRLSRELMREMLHMGLPVATEILQPMAAGYFDDLLSWVAIGARTTESQIHREMASGLPMQSASRTVRTVALQWPVTRSARRLIPIATSVWTAMAIRQSSRRGATQTRISCCAEDTADRTTTAKALPRCRPVWRRIGLRRASWSIAAMPIVARTRYASRRCSTMCSSSACKAIPH